MDNKIIDNIKNAIGLPLFLYMLNIDENAWDERTSSSYVFNAAQQDVLNDFSEILNKFMVGLLNQDKFTSPLTYEFLLHSYLMDCSVDNNSIFNLFRERCGGNFPRIESADKLYSFVASYCVKQYPNLLLRKPDHFNNLWMLHDTQAYTTEFIQLVKADIIDEITNKEDGFQYCFSFVTDDGMQMQQQIATVYSVLVIRSFFNACYRGNYDLLHTLAALKENLKQVRDLATYKKCNYSSFIGLKGLRLNDIEKIDLSQVIIHRIDNHNTPIQHYNETAILQSDEGIITVTGCVIEIKHEVILTENKPTATQVNTHENYTHQDYYEQLTKLSIVFALLGDKGITSSFKENGFSLALTNGHRPQSPYRNYLEINASQAENIKDIFAKLENTDLENISIPLERLSNAIQANRSMQDAIIDAFIAWEGIFSEASETTLKVTGSFAKFLYPPSDREKKWKYLKELYGLRSKIVHGSKKITATELSCKKTEAIQIGLEGILKLIDNEKLLIMPPSERVKQVLILNKYNCCE